MDWGMENRLKRIIQEDGNCFIMPIDHGYFQGPTTNLEKPGDTVKPLIPYIDAIFCTRGVLRASIPSSIHRPIILRVSGGTSIIGEDLSNEEVTTSIEEILRLNVSAVGISVYIGSKYEKQTLLALAELVNVCEDYAIPVMGVTAVGRELEKRDARYLSLCCRITAELGARIVKTYWCEDFEKVTGSCPVPVIIAGGPKCKNELEVFEFVYDGMQKGAIGVNLGRNVWQNPYPVAMTKALKAIVHEKTNAKDAYDVFRENSKN